MLELVQVRTQAASGVGPLEPFAPYPIGGPGDFRHPERSIVLDIRLGSCDAAGAHSASFIGSIELTYRFRGREYVDRVHLPSSEVLSLVPAEDCHRVVESGAVDGEGGQ